ncbi:L-methionine gamma-lyase [invertebrate metagenome]|uniref:L-methionine gamma-lyase n=1 Tax=invertebrate metagenome TaxID=1711999 RepID=A0A2H9T9Z7_9ZZZZ
MSEPHYGFDTRAIHTGYNPEDHQMALNPPVYMTSTYGFKNVQHGADLFAGKCKGHFYSRISNPTDSVLETRLADLEDAESAVTTASGMGAITSLCWTLLKSGDEVVADKTLYGCTFAFFQHGLTKFGVTVHWVDLSDIRAAKAAINEKTRVVFFETPANPTLSLVDISAISQIAHQYNQCRVVVDNTFATPVLQKPLTLGADFVVHSITKYLGGHGDLIAGCVMGKKEEIDQVRLVGVKDMTGASLTPLHAHLIMRGIKTLSLRVERHCHNALEVAKYLEKHPKIETVHYPWLPSHPQYRLAEKQMQKGGGMVCFEMKSGLIDGIKLMNSLKLVTLAVSLGDAESLIEHPASMTHSAYTKEERKAFGISDGLVRMSVGLESCEDILLDLDQALASL